MVDTLELDGRRASGDTDKALALAPIFFPSLPPVSDRWQTEIDHTWSTHRPPDVPGSVEVSIAEVVSAVRQMRPKAAPGLDDIPVSILKENLYIIAPWLALIYTASLSLHHFPESWKTAKVIPLKKPGKSSYSTPRSYQPISLLSHLGKALERIVNQRLMRQLESRCLLSPFQFGFCAGRQAISACLWITEDIYSAFRCGQQVQAVALDLQLAYDTVWRAGLLEKLSAMGGGLVHYLLGTVFFGGSDGPPCGGRECSGGGHLLRSPAGVAHFPDIIPWSLSMIFFAGCSTWGVFAFRASPTTWSCGL